VQPCKIAEFVKVMRFRNGTGATALAARASRARLRLAVRLRHGPIAATRARLWCDFDKRHRANARGTTVAISRRAV